MRADYLANDEVARERARRNVEYQRKRRRAAIDHYGGRCACCGESEYKFLAIDHVNGGGRQHRIQDPSALSIVSWLHRHGFPDGFRVLCHNCNMAYGQYGYCPHKRDGAQ